MMNYIVYKIDKDLDGLIVTDSGQMIKVPFTNIGESIEIKRVDSTNALNIAKSFEIINYIPNKRKSPICKYYTICGGCKGQHFQDEDYLKYKSQNTISLLLKYDVNYTDEVKVKSHLDSITQSRRRAIFSCDAVNVGFKKYKSNKVIDIANCPLLTNNISSAFNVLREVIKQYNKKFLIEEIIVSDIQGKIDILIKSKTAVSKELLESLQIVFAHPNIYSIYWQKGYDAVEALIIKEKIYIDYFNYKVPFTSGNFIQAESWGEQCLQQLIIKYTTSSNKVLDLFCGFGGYSFAMLSHHSNISKILAVDISAGIDAINSLAIPTINAVKRNLMKSPLPLEILNQYDTVVINPPRVGAFEQIKEIACSNIKYILMIYCSVEAAMRDMNILIKSNLFTIKDIVIVDQFIFSAQVEIFLYLVKKGDI